MHTLIEELHGIDVSLLAGEATPEQEARGQELVRLANAAPEMLKSALCAIAALSQNKTFPADIALAKKVLSAAIQKAKGN